MPISFRRYMHSRETARAKPRFPKVTMRADAARHPLPDVGVDQGLPHQIRNVHPQPLCTGNIRVINGSLETVIIALEAGIPTPRPFA